MLFGGKQNTVLPFLESTVCNSTLLPQSYQTQGTSWFFILAGGILGFTAALLWSAQGAIMMSYPLEKDKGKAFGIFWWV